MLFQRLLLALLFLTTTKSFADTEFFTVAVSGNLPKSDTIYVNDDIVYLNYSFTITLPPDITAASTVRIRASGAGSLHLNTCRLRTSIRDYPFHPNDDFEARVVRNIDVERGERLQSLTCQLAKYNSSRSHVSILVDRDVAPSELGDTFVEVGQFGPLHGRDLFLYPYFEDLNVRASKVLLGSLYSNSVIMYCTADTDAGLFYFDLDGRPLKPGSPREFHFPEDTTLHFFECISRKGLGRDDSYITVSVNGPPGDLPCVGDCNGDGAVTINEVISSVGISVGEKDLSQCESADFNGNGLVTINELISGVQGSLDGCH